MRTMEELKSQVEGTEDLSSIARAMKALAAVRIRQSRETVGSLATYAETLERGFQILLRRKPRRFLPQQPPDRRRTVALVIGSDLGMVGGFNRQMADFLIRRLGNGEGPRPELVTIGQRIAAELADAPFDVAARFSMPDTVEMMPERVQDLLVTLEGLEKKWAPDRMVVLYHHYRSGADYEARLIQLLPLDPDWLRELSERPWVNRRLPGFRVPGERLFSGLVREHLFLTLFRAMAESHASENAGRLAAMEAAEKRIKERMEELTGRLKQRRKQQMTEELLDMMAGVAAMEEDES